MSSHAQLSMNNTILSQASPAMQSRLMQAAGGSPINLSPGVQRRPLNDNDASDPASSQYYYRPREEVRKAQESGELQAPPWYLVPPVPEHLRGPSSGKSSGRFLPCSAFGANKSHSFFIDTDLRNSLLNRVHATMLQADEKLASHLPESVEGYVNLVPLEKPSLPNVSGTYKCASLCVKAFKLDDYAPFLLRVVRNVTVSSHSVHSLVEKLAAVQHPNLVPVRRCFTTNEFFGEPSTVFVFDFVPCASTLQHRHMSDPLRLTGFASPFNADRVARPVSAMKSAMERTMMPEAQLVVYLVQMLSGIAYVHKTLGMACRFLDPTKILVTDGQRIRINCLGMADMMIPLPDTEVEMYQKKDLCFLGQIMIGLACGTIVSVLESSMLNTTLEMVRQSYSSDVSGLLLQLWQEEIVCVDQAISAVAARAFDHTANLYSNLDYMETQLAKQMECDRLFRLVCKLATVCERNELGAESQWSETEGRYLLKLFRDFVFHQVDHSGAPWLDISHIVTCMNKLDVGSPEKTYLVSREGHNVIIATYAELKRCLDESYQYLMNKQIQSQQAMLSEHMAKMQLEADNDGSRRN